MQSDLVSAYRATDYVVHGNGLDVVIRIGYHSLITDKFLARMNATSGAFITAWNPFGHGLSLTADRHWDFDLKRYLSFRGIAFLEGEGRGRIGEWPPELSVFALGLSRSEASAIGRRYRQNAIVYVRQGWPAELLMLRWVR